MSVAPKEHWAKGEVFDALIEKCSNKYFGDHGQEKVFIGFKSDINKADIRANSCLIKVVFKYCKSVPKVQTLF